MAEQVGSRRAPYWAAGAVGGSVAALSMTGDIIFDLLDGPTAVAVCGGAAVLVGGLAWYHTVRTGPEPLTPAAAQFVPRHELPGTATWVGRQVLLDGLLAVLRDVPAPTGGALAVAPAQGQSKIIVIHGTPGAGKTTLALNAAHRVRDEYPDGQLYLELRGDGDEPRTSAEALEQLLRRLDVARDDIPAGVADRAALLRTLTNDRRLLIVLDNAHSTEQVRPLLPVGAGCAVLITSRKALSAGDVVARLPCRSSFRTRARHWKSLRTMPARTVSLRTRPWPCRSRGSAAGFRWRCASWARS
jgi:hypothetical protein